MTAESAFTFFVTMLIFSVTPGPGIFAILAKALVQGSRSCILLAAGMAVSDILYLIAACLGLAAIATHWGEVFTVIRVAGAIYLAYLGWKMWKAPLDLTAETQKDGKIGHAFDFMQGFLISASNPKVILFYIAFLPTFMDLTSLDAADIALASFLTFAGLMIGLMLVAVFAARARQFFTSEQSVRRMNRGAGSIMMGAAAYLITRN